MKKLTLFLFLVALIACNTPTDQVVTSSIQEKDPLSAWNENAAKKAIIDFVDAVSDEANPNYVAPADRIATFDNDGTLWCEKPIYIPVEIELAYIQNQFPNKPEWKSDKLYSSVAQRDFSVLGEYDTGELIAKLFGAHDGEKEEDYKKFVYQTLSDVNHSKFNRPLKEMTYLPMVQLVHFLQDNNFKVFIVTGGEITSVRTISQEIYNIPKENVVGSSVELKYVSDNTGPYIVRTAKINSANDKQVKPTNIELHIGQKPIFAAGNSDGDYQMMEYTLSGIGPSMAILVNHDDEIREYNYTHGTEKALKDAEVKGWHVVSMKNDFKEIFNN